MAILAAAFLPLLALQGQFVKSVEALDRVDARLETRDYVLQHLSSLNIYKTPIGEIRLSDAIASWEAVPALTPRPVRTLEGSPSRFEITLYEVKVVIRHNNGQVNDFIYKGLGWKPLRSLRDDF